MDILFDIYKRSVGLVPLFSVVLDIDFYDGPTEAICKLIDTERWFISSLVLIDFKTNQRVFTMLELNEQSLSEIRPLIEGYKSGDIDSHERVKDKVKLFFDEYRGAVYLFKSDWLNAIDYEITQVPIEHLKYFNGIEDVVAQNEESKLQWVNFFETPSNK